VELRTTSVVLIAGVLAVWAVAMIRRPSWRPRSRLLPAFLIALAAFAIGTALSRNPRLGLDYLAYSVLLTALYLLLVRLLADPWFRPRILSLTVLLALVVGGWYIRAVLALWFEWWGLVGRLAAPPLRPEFEGLTFGNPSAVLTMSVLLTIPAVAWVGLGTRRRLMANLALAALSLVVILLTGSRAGWLAIGVGAGLTALIWLAFPNHRASVTRMIRSRAIRIGLAAIAVIGGALAIALLPGFLLRAGAGGEGTRITFFQAALQMFSESPFHGTGPGTWVAQRILYTPAGDIDFYIPHAHNIALQTLAEFGLLGAAAAVVVGAFVIQLIASSVADSDSLRRTMGWAAALSLAYFVTHQMLDFYANFPPALFAFAVPLAFLDATSQWAEEPRRAIFSARATVPIGAGIVALAIGGLFMSESYAAIHARAVLAANEGRWSDAIADARSAAAGDPEIAAYQFTLGLTASHVGSPQESATAYGLAAAADSLPASWLGLAHARLVLGDAAGTRDALRQALRLGDQQPVIDVAAADLYTRIGESDAARAAFVDALILVPSLAYDAGFLGMIPQDQAGVVDAARQQLGTTPAGVELLMSAGQIDEATDLAGRLGPEERTTMQLVLLASNDVPAARSQLESQVRDRPLDSVAVAWAARTAAMDGDLEAVRRFRTWGLIIYGSTVPGDRALRVTRAPQPEETAGSTGIFYGHYTYRRPTPWDMIPAGVASLTARP
jgi:O-antigen ligase